MDCKTDLIFVYTEGSSIVLGIKTWDPFAKSAIDFLQVLPDLVRGKPRTSAVNLNAAIGPISSLTRAISSLWIRSGFLLVSKK